MIYLWFYLGTRNDSTQAAAAGERCPSHVETVPVANVGPWSLLAANQRVEDFEIMSTNEPWSQEKWMTHSHNTVNKHHTFRALISSGTMRRICWLGGACSGNACANIETEWGLLWEDPPRHDPMVAVMQAVRVLDLLMQATDKLMGLDQQPTVLMCLQRAKADEVPRRSWLREGKEKSGSQTSKGSPAKK